MKELISVIVPVYNVKLFLPECLKSILTQSYSNLEIILVDAGSNDGSERICDEYLLKDARIRVVHQTNIGVSVARNVGIDMAKGDFLTFVDSDDYIHKDMIKVLYDTIKMCDADISICNYSNEECLEINDTKNIKVISTLEEALKHLYNEYGICFGTFWCKLYKRTVFNQIRCPVGKIYEDMFVIHEVFEKAKKIVYTENKLYYYRIRKGSIMNSEYSLKNLDEIEAILNRMNFVKEHGFEYFYARDFYRYVNALRRNYKKLKKYFPNEKLVIEKIVIEFNKRYNSETRKLIFNKKIRYGLDFFHIKCLILEKYYKNRRVKI